MYREPVLLIERDHDGTELMRVAVICQPGIMLVIERRHLDNFAVEEHTWYHHGERALTGQRIFRPIKGKDAPTPGEHPMFDELRVDVKLHDPEFTKLDQRIRRDLADASVRTILTES